MLHYCAVLLCCTTVLYYCVVLLCCTTVLYYCAVLLCCTTVLYYCVVILCCTTVLYYYYRCVIIYYFLNDGFFLWWRDIFIIVNDSVNKEFR